MARRLKEMPIWVFHGAKDSVVPLTQSEEMVEAVKEAGGQAKLTVYPDANHDSCLAHRNAEECGDDDQTRCCDRELEADTDGTDERLAILR